MEPLAGAVVVAAQGEAAEVAAVISDRSSKSILCLDCNLPQIEPAMLRVFDRAKDTALFLPTEQRPRAPREQLQQRLVSRVDATLGHDVPGEFDGRHRPGRIPQGIEGSTCHVASDRPMRGARYLLADTLNVVARVKQPNRRVNVLPTLRLP
jgi:hypothetical protein